MLFYLLLELARDLLFSALFFPLPFNDVGSVRYRTIPWATLLLITINVAIFCVGQSAQIYAMERALSNSNAQSMDQLYDEIYRASFDLYDGVRSVWTYGYRAETVRLGVGIGAFVTITSMFMHANFSHLIGNMLYLWTFGRRVEDACGGSRFLLFYLTAGMVAGIGSALIKVRGGDVPSIGASGAIAGVLGAYLLLFPGARISCLWGIGLVLRTIYWGGAQIMGFDEVKFTWTVRLPAFLLLIAFAVTNIIPSLEIINQGSLSGGVDYLAHLTGFLAALVIFLFVRKDLLARYFSGRSV